MKELIQKEFKPKHLQRELEHILDKTHRNRIFADYYQLEKKLGGVGASEKTAALIYKSITAEDDK